MPMDLERHEEILGLLNNPETTHEERTNLLTELRSDYGRVLQEHADFTKRVEELETENGDLLKTNSMLFRDMGSREDPTKSNPTPEEQEQELAETITLNDLLK